MSPELRTNPFEGSKPSLPKGERSERRPEISAADRLHAQARKLDERFARLFATRISEGGSEAIRKLEVIEVLSDGVEDEGPEFALERPGINLTSRKLYRSEEEGAQAPESVEGVTKAEHGEVAYTMKDGKIVKILRRAKSSGAIEETFVPLSEGKASEQKRAEKWTKFLKHRPAFLRHVAEQYGIEVSEVPLDPERISFRNGIDVGQQTRSEFTVSRLDQLCGLDTVPITVLRKEKYGLASVQQLVDGRTTTRKDFEEAIKLPPDHPTAKSLIRMACLDFLTKAVDRHGSNMLFDEERQAFVAIDNGQAMGLSETCKVNFADKKTGEIKRTEMMDAPLDAMLSIPIELAELRPDWKLDEEAWQTMKTLYDELFQHAAFAAGELSLESQKALPSGVLKGETAKYLSDLFRFQFQQEKVAAKELIKFLGRLRYLIDHRRVPPMRDRKDFHIEFEDLSEIGIKN